jgi:hypothetical protein
MSAASGLETRSVPYRLTSSRDAGGAARLQKALLARGMRDREGAARRSQKSIKDDSRTHVVEFYVAGYIKR